MKCEMNYCIYNRNFICVLKETQLDALGICDNITIVDIPKNELEEYKSQQLQDIMSKLTEDNYAE